jgi:hypothetical protein
MILFQLVRVISKYSFWLYGLCGLGIIYYIWMAIKAKRGAERTIFTLERETTTGQAYRALSVALVFAVIAGVIFFIAQVLEPSLDFPVIEEPTPSALLMPTPSPSPVPPTMTPIPTPTRERPTPRPQEATETPIPTATPVPPTPICPNPEVQITSPGMDAILNGPVQILGRANIPNFQYYKVEVGSGENPTSWSIFSDIHKSPIAGGLLDIWDPSGYPPGVYKLRLTVVDNTGNYPLPCEVRVIVEHQGP